MKNYKNIELINKDIFEELRKNIIKSREAKDISQEQASKILNINQDIIINIENGDIKKLSNNIFTLGHIRTYLKWLNIDYNIFFKNINYTQSESKTSKKKSGLLFKLIQIIAFSITNILVEKLGKKTIVPVTTLISIIVSLLVISVWHKHTNNRIENYDVKNNYYDKKYLNDNNINNNGLMKIEPNESKNKTINNIKFIIISAKNDSWIEIQNNNSKIILSKFLKKDEDISIKYEKGLKLVTENAGSINIKINNITIDNIGKEGEVKRNISLDYANLLELNK